MAQLKQEIGARIKMLRENSNLSQRRFALMDVGMNRTYLSGVENRLRNISITNLQKIANGLGVSLEDLFRGLLGEPILRSEGVSLSHRRLKRCLLPWDGRSALPLHSRLYYRFVF